MNKELEKTFDLLDKIIEKINSINQELKDEKDRLLDVNRKSIKRRCV